MDKTPDLVVTTEETKKAVKPAKEKVKQSVPKVPKIHLAKYFALHSTSGMHKAFLTASPFRDEMHTEAELEKIIQAALTRRVT